MSIKANELDRSSASVLHPRYKYHQLTPQNGRDTVTLTNTSNPETIFDVPDNVQNWGESILTFDVLAANEAAAARFTYYYADSVPHFRDVQCYSDDTFDVCKQPFANKYTNTVMPRLARPEHVALNDSPVVATSAGGNAAAQLAAARLTTGVIEGLIPPANLESTLKVANGTAVDLQYNIDQSVHSAAAAAGDNAPILFGLNHTKRNDNVNTKSMLTEPRYNISSLDRVAALRGPFLKYRMKLKDIFPNHIIGLPFNQYFGTKMHLKLTWEIVSKIMWLADLSNDPVTGAANYIGDIEIENLHLFMAIEQNPTAIMELKNDFASGLSYKVPYTISHMQRIEPGTNATMTITYTKAQGEKLKRIYVVPYNVGNNMNLVNDHNNLAGAVIANYWTELNGVRTANANYNCVTGTDYTHLKHLVKGSCINSENSYYHNFVHEEKFIINAAVGTDQFQYLNNDWFDLSLGDLTYSFTGEVLVAKNFYVFAVFQRTIHINKDGITFSNN
eukprot:Lithocolla_globosa_v1_NODE_310_length_4558_cov_56.456362.p1 type:complete len:503 gc:universal NODE_310_length_4558_cov_56.456362:2697-4205(+)